ncbi:putative repeat protein (TIGR01451 family) [Paenibacillus sp. PastF-3]|uniref:DUF11 domain-containing protein n=1 Tax=Paenibacillus sp. PastF-3 TaxID=2940626 RepID=UPI002474FD89|nr:DUF11 domain-containing protein [Paenibacillus sp. PastF-3]MDH6373918.1 putative repeat protein (TIGR01451 family) [Paenibacillus sp. PastF-3]
MIPGSRTQPVVTNQSMVLFNSAAGVDGIVYSNTVNTPVVGPVLSLLKSTDKSHASLGDTLVYTITASNNGNTEAVVTVYDTLPEGVSFISNSVLRDGVPLPGATPSSGITLGSIAPQSQVNIAFQVVIISLPSTLVLQNKALGRFSFATPEGRIINGDLYSNSVFVSLLSYQLSTSLTASTPTSFIGDVVTYTLRLTNEGNSLLNQISATISIPNGAVFIPGSVIAGGVYYPESDPMQGIGIGQLDKDLSIDISFRVRVTEIPPSLDLTNRAAVTYTVDDDPNITESNTVVVSLVLAGVTISKRVDHVTAAPGDNLRYELTVSNSGNLAVNAILTDAIPPGTLFVWDSVLLNGVMQKGARPADGIQLGTLRGGTSAVVVFQVSVPAAINIQAIGAVQNHGSVQYTFVLPDGRTVRQTSRSNTVTTLIVTPVISLETHAKPTLVEEGEHVQCWVSLTNSGNWPAKISLDRLSPEECLIDPSSIVIDGIPNPQSSFNGILSLGTVKGAATVNIHYFVRVSEHVMMRFLKGLVTAQYSFNLDGREYAGKSQSNSYTLTVDEISE